MRNKMAKLFVIIKRKGNKKMKNKFEDLTKGVVGLLMLAAIVLTTLGIITGFEKALRIEKMENISFTSGVVGESKLVGTSEQYPYLQSMVRCMNGTAGSGGQNLSAAYYTTTEGSVVGGTFTLSSASATHWNNSALFCDLTYLDETAGSESAQNFTTGILIFGSFSAVLVLGIVGMAIIGIFKRK